MRKATLVNHTTATSPTTILFLSQIATLVALISAWVQGDDSNAWKAYVRSAINSEPAATAVKEDI